MSQLVDSIVQYQQRIGMHRAGSCSAGPLEKLEWYLVNYFDSAPIRSIETGCGASTIVFANYVARHTAYCYDDREFDASSVKYAQDFPGFRQDRVEWIFGPTQRTIFEHPPTEQFDLVLLDGPHGYPFPELEYFVFYNHLRPGGILIIDDIHIPTINQLYRFLLEDESFLRHGLAATTAYFQRTQTPAFNMEGDDWWLQRFNAQRFPAVPIPTLDLRLRIPVTLRFDAGRLSQSPVLLSGFSPNDSPPLSDGPVSVVEVPIERDGGRKLALSLDIEPVSVEQRQDSGVSLVVNAQELGSWSFDAPGRRTIDAEVKADGADSLRIECSNRGLKTINELDDWAKPWFDARLPNFFLHSITIRDAASNARPNTLNRADGSIVSFDYRGQEFRFFVDEPGDSIQAYHANGQFFALIELEALQTQIACGARVLDVGAHVGNHTIYFEKVLGASRVVPIEPNPRAQFMLRTNCQLNGLKSVDLAYLDRGLGSANANASLVRGGAYSSGAAWLRTGRGEVVVSCGDDLFGTEQFDLIKIDVHGMELEVLQGLAGTIQRCRPVILLEVDDRNIPVLAHMLQRWGLAARWSAQVQQGRTTFIIATASDATKAGDLAQSPSSVVSSASLREQMVQVVRPFVPRPLRPSLRKLVGGGSSYVQR